MNNLYSNVGKKLMTYAVVIAVLLTIIGLFAGLAMMTQNVVIGVIIIILYSLLAYLSSLFTYAYGRLVQSAENIENYLLSKSNGNEDE